MTSSTRSCTTLRHTAILILTLASLCVGGAVSGSTWSPANTSYDPSKGQSGIMVKGNILVLSVDLNKTDYALGEPIIVRLSITNTSKEPVTDRWFAYTRGFYVDMQTPEGRMIQMPEYYSENEQMLTTWECMLAPGKSVTTAFDLTRGDILDSSPFFPRLARSRGASQRGTSYIVKPGTYRLLVTHALQMNGVHSGPRSVREFTIRAPSDEESKALKLFESQPNLHGKGAASPAAALGNYEKVWTQYPRTPCAPFALYYAARVLQQQRMYGSALAKYDLLAKQYPEFPLPEDLLYYKTLALRSAGQTKSAREAGVRLWKYTNHLVSPDVVMPNRQKGSRIQLLLDEMGLGEIRPRPLSP